MMAIPYRLPLGACFLMLTACAASPSVPLVDIENTSKSDVHDTSDTDDVAVTLTTAIDVSVPPPYRKQVEYAQIEGLSLFREDRAAWLATDAVVAAGIVDRHRSMATGWLAQQQDADGRIWNVAFTAKDGEQGVAYADVHVDLAASEPIISTQENTPPRRLSGWEEVLTYARIAFSKKEWLRCADTYNPSTQVFVDEGRKYVVVRMLPAQLKPDHLPMGGFHRFKIPMFEGESVDHFAQTSSCIDIDTSALDTNESFGMTLTTTSAPTEFDVFTSLSYRRPHYVITDAGSWLVENGKIRWLSEPKETP
ncbi:MAG: hypothetical protein IPH43_02345 [Xanthomonadales bacterium]|uniref:hypothetical protein n=2 Tax=Dokdonella sp. TaxID=2291710 RepID=UPI002CA7926F|nr:hypothetical protein [Xanthomonadales bacterium]HQW77722.1 hypothetical protein [Dokdonella sp.]MBK7011639.1 hypothetical protein [Xanthomonadales bacterium]MBK7209325.1 hypothetical protein [Xanthomonadales bacterium]MBL0223490.1 hypothetical protein [Xanthomonadales bacterium]